MQRETAMKKIYLAFMCLALIPFSVNAASIEDILGRWEGEEKIAGLEYITISQDSFREGRQAVNPCTIKQDGELFIITIKEDFWGEENITTYKAYKKDDKLILEYTNIEGQQAKTSYIRPPKSPDHQ